VKENEKERKKLIDIGKGSN